MSELFHQNFVSKSWDNDPSVCTLIDWVSEWVTDWLTDPRTHTRTQSFTHSLTHTPTHPLTHSLTHPLTHAPTHSHTHSAIDNFDVDEFVWIYRAVFWSYNDCTAWPSRFPVHMPLYRTCLYCASSQNTTWRDRTMAAAIWECSTFYQKIGKCDVRPLSGRRWCSIAKLSNRICDI